MGRRSELIYFGYRRNEKHKGFYNDPDPERQLSDVEYTEFFEFDDNCIYSDASQLLRGSCHIFALSLSKILGYTPYLIERKDKKGFHAFCQVYKNYQQFYVDARGVTASFDEFMDVAGDFVTGEFIVREITPQDIEKWENTEDCYEEALLFSEAVIKEYEECYRI